MHPIKLFKEIFSKFVNKNLFFQICLLYVLFFPSTMQLSYVIPIYILHSDKGFMYSSNLVGISFTLFGFAITAKNILNYKHTEYFINIPIKTIMHHSTTDLYYFCWYNISFCPVFMLISFCIYSEVNLTPYVLFSFSCFALLLITTYKMISLENTQDILSAMLLQLSLEDQKTENENLRKNLLSSLFLDNRKNISSSEYKIVFNEFIKTALTIIDKTYKTDTESINMPRINKKINERINEVEKKESEILNLNIAIFVFDYLNYTLKSCKSNVNSMKTTQDDLINIDLIVKNLINDILDNKPWINTQNTLLISDISEKSLNIYIFYINSIAGLLIAVLKNTNVDYFANTCLSIKDKLYENEQEQIKKFYMLGYFNALVCAVIDYCTLNQIIPTDCNLSKLVNIYEQYIDMCNHYTFDTINKFVSDEFELKYTDNYSSFKNIICEINKEIKKYNRTPLFLAQYKWKG